jgi:hypothetical protein
MQALQIHAGPVARRHLAREGLRPADVSTIPGAAGGPKGLILGPLDRFIFGEWLSASDQEVHLLGASIGAWRMATACLPGPLDALQQLEDAYISQDFKPAAGQARARATDISAVFANNLEAFFGSRVPGIITHPRYRLHVVTSRGRGLLARDGRIRTPMGYLGAYLSNALHRPAMGAWLERIVFSSPGAALPFDATDYPTRRIALSLENFKLALRASCSIPFLLESVQGIPGAPSGPYWDGGITDYHLHLNYAAKAAQGGQGLVLYPHFQRSVVPGWLDKHLPWRHRPSAFLDNMVLLTPRPDWVRTLPQGKLPDRSDFMRYGADLAARMQVWRAAVSASAQLADEFATWLGRPDLSVVQAL